MIEAVNSVVANAPLLRGNAEQGGQPRANIAASSNNTKVEAPVAPFVSPYIQVDNNFNKAVIQIRDSNTGDVVRQFPSETTLRVRAAQAELDRVSSQNQQASVETPQSSGGQPSQASFLAIQQQAVQSSQAVQQDTVTASNVRVAEAQIASAALQAGASSGVSQTSVSVTA